MKLDTMYPEGVRNVVFAPVSGTPTLETLALRHVSGNECKDLVLKDEIARLGLDEEQTKLLVRRVVEAMLEQWANPKAYHFFYGHMWGSALFAARMILPQDEKLHRRLLLATVVYCGGHTKYKPGLSRTIMPAPMKGEGDERTDYSFQEVIDYLLSVGCSEDEVRTAWVEMIQTRRRDNFKTGYVLDWYDGLKVGEKSLDSESGIIEAARQMLLYELKDVLVKGWGQGRLQEQSIQKEYFDEIVKVLIDDAGYDWCRSEDTREIVEEYFVDCFARGAAGSGRFMLTRFGSDFNLWSEYRKGSFDEAMAKLMRGAMSKAEEERHYGVAAALAEHLGESVQTDSLREKAQALDQKVALNFAS